MIAGSILIDEADGSRRIAFGAEYYLEEGFGYGDFVPLADGAVLLIIKDRAADDVYLSFFLCPMAAGFFQFFPVSTVQVVVLRQILVM